MKANELRIGNLVDSYSDSNALGTKAHVVMAQDIVDLENGELQRKGIGVVPIQLTEEWLISFGLEKNKESQYELTGILKIHPSFKTVSCLHIVIAQCIYVHQLQNLYFALTGTELEIVS